MPCPWASHLTPHFAAALISLATFRGRAGGQWRCSAALRAFQTLFLTHPPPPSAAAANHPADRPRRTATTKTKPKITTSPLRGEVGSAVPFTLLDFQQFEFLTPSSGTGCARRSGRLRRKPGKNPPVSPLRVPATPAFASLRAPLASRPLGKKPPRARANLKPARQRQAASACAPRARRAAHDPPRSLRRLRSGSGSFTQPRQNQKHKFSPFFDPDQQSPLKFTI